MEINTARNLANSYDENLQAFQQWEKGGVMCGLNWDGTTETELKVIIVRPSHHPCLPLEEKKLQVYCYDKAIYPAGHFARRTNAQILRIYRCRFTDVGLPMLDACPAGY